MARLLVLCLLFLSLLFSAAEAAAAAAADVFATADDDPVSRDRAALLSFASAVTSDPGGVLTGWGAPGSNACAWAGVTCHRVKRRVVQLILSGRGLRGAISPAVGNLSFLVVLDLSENFFSGGIPPEIGYLPRLQQLSLSKNLLTGGIPLELGFLRQLIYLDLDGNRLSGRSPKTLFCNCTSLQYVDLSNNSLAGEIPLAGECPLPDLRFVLLWSNNFEGPIPAALSNSSKLAWIDFESNRLTGVLPSGIFDKMPFLQYLYLSYNNLSSEDDNTNLTPFFASLRNCSHLQELELAGNNLGGRIPPFIGDLSINLVQLHLDENAISGPIPPNISNLVNLTYLNLSYNYLNGSIPPDLSRLQKLERVYLSNNLLSGDIPPSLGEIPRLGLLDISTNRLTGSIPDRFSKLSQLRTLLLHRNLLSGRIPASLGNCVNLEILDLSHNKLTGRIPSDVAALGSLKLYLNLSSNLLEGPLPLELSKMDMILRIDLSSNNFSGVIPPQLGSCVALEYLNLSGNSLRGPLPGSVGALPYLNVLDVSMNRLSGTLPESLPASVSLKQLNVSFNNFSGAIPAEGVFTSLSADSFLGNEGLCGSIPGVSSCETKRARRPVTLPVLLGSVGAACFVLASACSVVRRSRTCRPRLPTFHRQALIEAEEEQKPQHHPRISYRQLVEATGGFSESNLVGGGRFGQVYKGTLRDDTRIAVKVLDPGTAGGGAEVSGSFKRECQVLKRTRHRNLIRVITACSKPDFKALVLPLMPNGSLEKFLYPDPVNGESSLGLHQLVSILSDVAEGVAYLHHYSPFRVIHCDLKPSNVLLDEDMTALVADFGISKLMRGADEESSACNSITGLLQGSVGYIAPEYGLGGQPSTQGDVYSFGVILLEIITGRRPTDVIFHEALTLHDWVKGQYPHNVEAITSRSPLMRESSPWADAFYYNKLRSDVVAELIELGLVCTQLSPSLRPTMTDVAQEISILKQDLPRLGPADDDESCSTANDSSF